jgi:hypothetical protein
VVRILPTFFALGARWARKALFTTGPNEYVVIGRTGIDIIAALIESAPMGAFGLLSIILSLAGQAVSAWAAGVFAALWLIAMVAPALPQLGTPSVQRDARDALRAYGAGYRILSAARAPNRLRKGPATKRNTVDRIAGFVTRQREFSPCYVTAISAGAARKYREHLHPFGTSGRVFVGLHREARPEAHRPK